MVLIKELANKKCNMLSAYILHILIIAAIFSILAVSLNLAVGYTGLLNIGHIAFFGIGAYTSAILVKSGTPFLLAILASGILAAIFGWLLTVLTNKLKGDYMALATLGFAFVVYSFLLNWHSVTRGPLGIAGIPRPSIFGWVIKNNFSYLIFVLLFLVLITTFLYKLTKSRYGKLLEAVRDDAIGLAALGKNIFQLKYQSMMISAFLAGVAGSLYAHYISFIDPSTFFLTEIIAILTIIIIGGLASLKGSIIATLIVVAMPELLRFVNLPSQFVGPSRLIMWGLIVILILLYKPRGLFGKVDLE